jgi:hypothetical protein
MIVESNGIRRNKRIVFVICAFFIFSLPFSVSGIAATQLFFVYGQPGTDMPNKMPFPTIIYRYDLHSGALEEMWSTDDRVKTINILNLLESGRLILMEDYSRFHVFRYHNIPQTIPVAAELLAPINRRFYYVQDADESGAIIVFKISSSSSRYPPGRSESKLLSIEDGQVIDDVELSKSRFELKLAGLISPYGNGSSNVLGVNIEPDGSLKPIGLNFNITDVAIPKHMIQMDSSLGWAVIANKSDYMALISSAHRHGLTHRELLILNKLSNKWSSVLIEGAETAPTIVNDWLVGIVADVDPETDYETRKGFPPILHEDVVLVNPIDGQHFKVHLGKNGEVLWIEDTTVYYRIDDRLYTAHIENSDFIDRQLLLTDDRVRHFHWAFRGSTSKDDIVPDEVPEDKKAGD